jgi:quercetin dioxygenase-like cupin family protein
MNANESTCHPGDGTKSLDRLPYLPEALLRFNLQQELHQLRREVSRGREAGRSSRTLAKYPDFRIVLVLKKAATHMDEQRAEARISIQVLVGRIRLHLPELEPVELSAGQLLALDCGMLHDVEALAKSAFLLTVSWWKGTAKP